MLIFPATFLALTLFAFNFIGDGLRDAHLRIQGLQSSDSELGKTVPLRQSPVQYMAVGLHKTTEAKTQNHSFYGAVLLAARCSFDDNPEWKTIPHIRETFFDDVLPVSNIKLPNLTKITSQRSAKVTKSQNLHSRMVQSGFKPRTLDVREPILGSVEQFGSVFVADKNARPVLSLLKYISTIYFHSITYSTRFRVLVPENLHS